MVGSLCSLFVGFLLSCVSGSCVVGDVSCVGSRSSNVPIRICRACVIGVRFFPVLSVLLFSVFSRCRHICLSMLV